MKNDCQGDGVSFQGDVSVLKLVVMVVQIYDYTKNCTLSRDFMLSELQLNENVLKSFLPPQNIDFQSQYFPLYSWSSEGAQQATGHGVPRSWTLLSN